MGAKTAGYGFRGPKGDKGDASTVPGPKGDTGAASTIAGPKGDKGDTGAPGTPAPTNGRLALIGNVVVTETTLLALGLGMKRMTIPLVGITSADMGKLIVVPNGAATAGCEVQNAYPTAAAGQVSIGYFTPALGLAATYSIPVSVYRIT